METTPRLYLGQILVRRGLLRQDQVMRILREQLRCRRPFGVLAERLCGVDPADVEDAWRAQYLSHEHVHVQHADLTPTADAAASLSRRQAWQFRALPLRRRDGWLEVATDPAGLARTVLFLNRAMREPVHVLIADGHELEQALTQTYGACPGSPARVGAAQLAGR